MTKAIFGNRYLIMRRVSQLTVLGLFMAGNLYGLKILTGNLSSSRLFNNVPLSDPFALLQVFATGNTVSGDALIGGAVIFSFFALIGGRAFCSWICPMNMVTDLANSIRHYFPGMSDMLRPDRNIRYWAAGLALLLSAASGIAAFEWISPISALHRGLIFGMGAGWMAVAAVFLFDLVLVRNGFCGHVCPLGGFYSLISRFSFVRVKHDKERCTLCMKCIENCPERQVLPMVGRMTAVVNSGECTNCARCIDACSDKAMGFGMRYFSRKSDDQKR